MRMNIPKGNDVSKDTLDHDLPGVVYLDVRKDA